MQRKQFFLFFFIFLLSFGYNSAQQNRFIYIQTENKQPFYVKVEKKVLSSSSSGYIILPKLKEGEYLLVIGFPKSEWPEQHFNCIIEKRDIGFLLKDFGDKGWGLFNFQTLEILLTGISNTAKKTETAEIIQDDFSDKLAKVVNDPTIKQTKVLPVEPIVVKKELAKQVETEKKKVPVDTNDVTVPVEKNETFYKSTVTKKYTSSNDEGTEIVYLDVKNGIEDTIRVFIPTEKSIEVAVVIPAEKSENIQPVIDTVKDEVKVTTPVPEPVKEIVSEVKTENDKKFLDVELTRSAEVIESTKTVSNVTIDTGKELKDADGANISTELKLSNSNCKSDASEDDFLKLRKKMASAKDDDAMISIAKKIFKSKCFTTQQIKNLAVLFLNDAGKYQFFDAAYQFVSDAKNFANLESSLTDAYYINRFKVMINH